LKEQEMPAVDVELRPARPEDAPAIAAIWHLGWRDGHLGNVPAELTAARRENSFGAGPGDGARNDFWAQGNHGQFIYVAPSRDLVLVRFGTGYNYDHWPELLAGLARRL
jgi:CubicO group peptidase (beta-lactamase class C family)